MEKQMTCFAMLYFGGLFPKLILQLLAKQLQEMLDAGLVNFGPSHVLGSLPMPELLDRLMHSLDGSVECWASQKPGCQPDFKNSKPHIAAYA